MINVNIKSVERMLIWLVVYGFILGIPVPFSEAQTATSSIFPKTISSALAEKGKSGQIEFVTLTCPVDGRQFQIGMTLRF